MSKLKQKLDRRFRNGQITYQKYLRSLKAGARRLSESEKDACIRLRVITKQEARRS